MKKFEVEWGFYLQAYRLLQGLTKNSNEESYRLLRSAFAATPNDRVIARAYGLQSFGILTAWLCNWIDDDAAKRIVAGCRADVKAAEGSEISGFLNTLQQEGLQRDIMIRTAVKSHGHKAKELDDSDFENHWSAATADLYDRNFQAASKGYQEATKKAQGLEIPEVGRSSLAVDYADFRFFAGNDALDNSDGAWIKAITQAIDWTLEAQENNKSDPKRHRWYWTLGWAYYERAAYENEQANLDASLKALQQIRVPHDLIRKNLIATHVALGNMEEAEKIAAEFWANNDGYTIDVEDRWPYRIAERRDRWKSHLAQGLGI